MARSARRRIVSWNVNGLRACANKGFAKWLADSGAEIAGVQEVRALRDELPAEVGAPSGWHAHFSAAAKRGYSGVGLYARREADAVDEVLAYVQYDRRSLVEKVRRTIEQALRKNEMTSEESARLVKRYEQGLQEYTYLSRDE